MSRVFYEPEEMTMVPDREFAPVAAGYNPAIDYESQFHIEKVVEVEELEESSCSVQAEVKSAEKDKKVRKSQDGVLDKRWVNPPTRRMSGASTSRINLPTMSQMQAEDFRSYKADLQKLKKEQEEEQMKLLEALKLERQKGIAARNNNAKPTQQVKPKPVSKPTQKTSKFTDADPNSTPFRRAVTKTTPSKSTGSENGLTRPFSSLSDAKKEKNGSDDRKRLSELYEAVRASPSPVLINEVISSDMEARCGSSEVVKREELSANTEIHSPVERPYQASMARLSSMAEVHPVSTTLKSETPAQIESIQMPDE